MTYRKLRPEVKQTLEKIVYQLELVGKTLQLMEQRVMDSEDKLQEVMTFIKTSDLDYRPLLVNKVMSMNRYDEVTGEPLLTESPKKDFGVPLPGEPSLAYTLEKNRLADLYGRFANSLDLLGEHPEARQLMEDRGLGQAYTTGRFQPQSVDVPDHQRPAMVSAGNSDSINVNSESRFAQLGDPNFSRQAEGTALGSGSQAQQQPEMIHSSNGTQEVQMMINQARASETEQALGSVVTNVGEPSEAVNVFSTRKFDG